MDFDNILTILILLLVAFILLLFKYSQKLKYYFKFVFSYGCLILLSWIFIPYFLIRPGNINNILTYTEIAKYINNFIGIKWTLRGAEHLRQNKCFIIVANHQSCMDHLGLIDILYVMKRMSVVAKKELVYFFPGWYLTELVFIDRKNSKSKLVLDEAVEKFKKENVKLWIYPEGTRRNKGEIHSFKKGAFHSAIRHQIPIVPLVFSSYRHILDHEKKIFNEGEMIIQALPEISTAGLTLMDIDELIQQTRQKMIEIYDKLSAEIAENSNLN